MQQLKKFICECPKKNFETSDKFVRFEFWGDTLLIWFNYQVYGVLDYKFFETCNKYIENFCQQNGIKILKQFDTPSGEFFADYCDEIDSWCGFYSADDVYGKSGHAYASGDKFFIDEWVKNRNEDINGMLVFQK